MCAESERHNAQGAREQQAQAEEEARLALLTAQAGMKLTLTDKVTQQGAALALHSGSRLLQVFNVVICKQQGVCVLAGP